MTGAVRVDNNSAFGNQIKWVTYPKASLSWVASDERDASQQHMPSFIDNLRLRGAYGGSGQQPAYNTALRTLRPSLARTARRRSRRARSATSNLKPERVFGTRDRVRGRACSSDRIGIDFTYYNDVSKDAILSRGVAPSTGFGASSQFFNAGEIQKYGHRARRSRRR